MAEEVVRGVGPSQDGFPDARRPRGEGMPDRPESFVSGAMRHLQDNVRRAGPAAAASYALIGAIVLLGGAGHVVDRWQGTEPWGLLAGLLAGLVVGFYELAKMIWRA